MTRLIGTLLAAPLLLASVSALAQAPGQNQNRPPGVVVTNVASAHATVQNINRAKRTATLRTDDGREFTVDVPDSVKNFDQIQKGDHVNIRYHEATAVFLQKPGESGTRGSGSSSPPATEPSATQRETIETAPRGQKPAMLQTHVVELVATVENVDRGKRTITLRGPEGNVRTVDVGDNVPNLDRVKKGDKVVVRRTEAVAASVTK